MVLFLLLMMFLKKGTCSEATYLASIRHMQMIKPEIYCTEGYLISYPQKPSRTSKNLLFI